MSVKYLSQEWAEEFTARAAAGNTAPYKGKNAVLLNVVREVPGGDEVRYVITFADNAVAITMADAENPDVTMTQAYDTAVAINKGELDGQRAFMQGKVKVGGKMVKMMTLRAALTEVSNVLAGIDTEY
jgi:putative sterol carrier protein